MPEPVEHQLTLTHELDDVGAGTELEEQQPGEGRGGPERGVEAPKVVGGAAGLDGVLDRLPLQGVAGAGVAVALGRAAVGSARSGRPQPVRSGSGWSNAASIWAK